MAVVVVQNVYVFLEMQQPKLSYENRLLLLLLHSLRRTSQKNKKCNQITAMLFAEILSLLIHVVVLLLLFRFEVHPFFIHFIHFFWRFSIIIYIFHGIRSCAFKCERHATLLLEIRRRRTQSVTENH